MSFWCLQFSQKTELENSNFCPSLLGQKFLVHFLEELKKTKNPFKINWPLVWPVLDCPGQIWPDRMWASLTWPEYGMQFGTWGNFILNFENSTKNMDWDEATFSSWSNFDEKILWLMSAPVCFNMIIHGVFLAKQTV